MYHFMTKNDTMKTDQRVRSCYDIAEIAKLKVCWLSIKSFSSSFVLEIIKTQYTCGKSIVIVCW